MAGMKVVGRLLGRWRRETMRSNRRRTFLGWGKPKRNVQLGIDLTLGDMDCARRKKILFQSVDFQ